MQLNGSTFIVTGGSSGLGEATVRRFRAAGARLVIADVNVEAGQKLAADLKSGAVFCKTDVTEEADAQAAVAAAQQHFGALNGLINCAGIGTGERVVGKQGPHRLDSFSRVIRVNLIGTFNMIRIA